MSISQFPAPATGDAGTSAFAATLTAMNTYYTHTQSFDTGVYTVSVDPSTTDARLFFVSDSAVITTQTTTSGSVSFNLTTAATKVIITGLPGGTAGAVVTIEKTADPLTSTDIGNGTLDTINTTGTYNQTGLLGVLVLSGGERGGNSPYGNAADLGGPGGRAGFINGGVVWTNTATTVTIGAGGVGSLNAPVAATNSSFGTLIVANTTSNVFPNGNGGGAGYNNGTSGNASGVFPSWNTTGTTGGGGGAAKGNVALTGTGAGSGIGTGGTSAGSNGGNAATAGTGKASGGGGGTSGGSNTTRVGADGAPGVVYVLRGF